MGIEWRIVPLCQRRLRRQDFVDAEPQDGLLLVEAELVETVGEAAEESFQGVGELEVGLGGSSFDAAISAMSV
ncbi:MAG: hypothetical protein ACRDPA_05010 [Solirubrobacteraceae bacterium]